MKNGLNKGKGLVLPYKILLSALPPTPPPPPPPPGLHFGAVILQWLCHGCLVKIVNYATITILSF